MAAMGTGTWDVVVADTIMGGAEAITAAGIDQ
jgi:hypothetical protein